MLARKLRIVLLVFACALAHAAVVPAGTRLEIRLKSKVASNASKATDPVEAILIMPITSGEQILVPAGVAVTGAVKSATPITKQGDRATLELDFSRLAGAPIAARLVAVDNARERVDDSGKITGILASETLAARISAGVDKVTQKYAKLGDFLGTIASAVVKEPEPEIVYEPGVEMTLELTRPATIAAAPAPQAVAAVTPEAKIFDFVNSQPFQTTSTGGTPSDLTNLMFIGSEGQLSAAFQAAGWSTAAQLNAQSGLEVFRAVAEMRGYKEAPMSVLLLDGQKPDVVFQKQNNTFAMRHHLRIWRRPGTFDGKPVWVCAATHDIGIDFSPEKRTFIHKIDSEIDHERAKVVADLLLTGHVKALSLVARPSAPRQSSNATGDKLITDGAMAVLVLE
jgi:hypothetical protein